MIDENLPRLSPDQVAELDAWFDSAKEVLNLSGWEIFVEPTLFYFPDDEVGGPSAATYADAACRSATIRIGSSLVGLVEREVKRVLCHELIHILDYHRATLVPRESRSHHYNEALEEFCTAMGDIIAPMMPAPPSFLVGDEVPGEFAWAHLEDKHNGNAHTCEEHGSQVEYEEYENEAGHVNLVETGISDDPEQRLALMKSVVDKITKSFSR